MQSSVCVRSYWLVTISGLAYNFALMHNMIFMV